VSRRAGKLNQTRPPVAFCKEEKVVSLNACKEEVRLSKMGIRVGNIGIRSCREWMIKIETVRTGGTPNLCGSK
jgi:hypothetical protein